TAVAGDVSRRAVAAPFVEHVGVLYSAETLRETLNWLDDAYGRASATDRVAATGPWIAGLLFGIVALSGALAGLLREGPPPQPAPRRAVIVAALAPALIAPLVATQIRIDALPVLVADYLAVHMAIYGALQLAILYAAGARLRRPRPSAVLFLLALGLGGFGFALDRYAASFAPFGPRLPILAAVALGAVVFMLADALAKEGGRAPFVRRAALFLAFIASLVFAAWLDSERLLFLLVVLPVIVLFFLIYGLMGRWVALRAGPSSAGIALGLILAWSIAASFPLFEA
ncbi:MAG: alpha/beta hydrolase, partial [Pseudomonadota bacterium]